ncbi:dienelactone hydrolase family protein [Lichtheimia corymbifera JMRC:FSU:9682]|uniref:Dienelactone hydrolase family protein n=1 Tax=Lichtheimia corymbifera JMRC:FSU:9682 TaxID=1263082 RepID=A0A068RJ14_9FUNG|nr:dienelactone hydrolase family protein [Lichtheimia corymbifera JMRC:FSU:9682]
MSHSHACCTIPPVASDYQAVGTIEKVGADELPVYVVGPKDAKKAILVIYDIFGLHNNTKQFCDILAKECGYKVVMPDFFRGEPWTDEKMGDMQALIAWIGKVGSIEVVSPQIKSVTEWLQGQGVTKAGLVGFCWGAKISVQMTAIDSFFGGASLVHPSFVDVKDAEKAGAPILALPSKDEPDMTEYMKVLSQKPFGDKCAHRRFDDQPHGFAAARGDYTDELNKKRATEAIQLTANFFSKVLSDN